MTLSGLNDHFTFNFLYYELILRVIIYLFSVASVYLVTYTCNQPRCAEAEYQTVIRRMFGIREKTVDLS